MYIQQIMAYIAAELDQQLGCIFCHSRLELSSSQCHPCYVKATFIKSDLCIYQSNF